MVVVELELTVRLRTLSIRPLFHGTTSRGHRARGTGPFLVPRLPPIRGTARGRSGLAPARRVHARLRLRNRPQPDDAAALRPRRPGRFVVVRSGVCALGGGPPGAPGAG